MADFQTGGAFLAYLDASDEGYPSMEEGGAALIDRLLESVGAIPGVALVALSTGFPLDRVRARVAVDPAGRPSATGAECERKRVHRCDVELLRPQQRYRHEPGGQGVDPVGFAARPDVDLDREPQDQQVAGITYAIVILICLVDVRPMRATVEGVGDTVAVPLTLLMTPATSSSAALQGAT